jgi:hypothetical protein
VLKDLKRDANQELARLEEVRRNLRDFGNQVKGWAHELRALEGAIVGSSPTE